MSKPCVFHQPLYSFVGWCSSQLSRAPKGALLRHQPIHFPRVQPARFPLWFICTREPRSFPSLTSNRKLDFVPLTMVCAESTISVFWPFGCLRFIRHPLVLSEYPKCTHKAIQHCNFLPKGEYARPVIHSMMFIRSYPDKGPNVHRLFRHSNLQRCLGHQPQGRRIWRYNRYVTSKIL